MIILRTIMILALSIALFDLHSSAERIYVNAAASPGGNGTSWDSAFQYLQDALDQTVAGRTDEIWIAQGTYYPDDGANVTEGDREAFFFVNEGTTLYGGFVGGETSITERDWETNKVFLSGNIYGDRTYDSLVICKIEKGTIDGINMLNIEFDGIYCSASVNVYNSTFLNGGDSSIIFLRERKSIGTNDLTPIDPDNVNLSIYNCIFKDNKSVSIIYMPSFIGSMGTYILSNISLEDSIFNGNLFCIKTSWLDDKTKIFVGNCEFQNNSLTVFEKGKINITNSIFHDNPGDLFSGSKVNANKSLFESVRLGSYWDYSDFNAMHCVFSYTVVAKTKFVCSSSIFQNVFLLDSNGSISNSTAVSNKTALDVFEITHESIKISGGEWIFFNNIFINDITLTDSVISNLNTEQILSPNTPRASNIIQGGAAVIPEGSNMGEGYILDVDPHFVDPTDPDGPDDIWGTTDDGLRLLPTSPAIGAGNIEFLARDNLDIDNDGITDEPIPRDLAGFNRLQGGSLDLGAYEFGDETVPVFTFVTESTEGGITTPSGSASYPEGTQISVMASALPGYLFEGWSGDALSEENPLEISISKNTSITANFIQDLNDSDDDGLSNYTELVTYGTNPDDPDSDSDGIFDGDEIAGGLDPMANNSALITMLQNNPQYLPNLYSLDQIQYARMDALPIAISETGQLQLKISIFQSTDLLLWTKQVISLSDISITDQELIISTTAQEPEEYIQGRLNRVD